VPAAALAAQFQLQQRMVAGITATYQALTYVQRLRDALAATTKAAASGPSAAEVRAGAQAIDAALASLEGGPAGLGVGHRDLGRRLNDQLVGDVEPTPSVIAGVDVPCEAIDTALDGLRRLESTTIAELNTTLARAGLAALPLWTPPAAPSCGPR